MSNSQIIVENRDAALQFLQHHYHPSHNEDPTPHANLTDFINMSYSGINDKIEYGLFEEMITNHCLLHFQCTARCYRNNMQSTYIGHENENRYYVNSCSSDRQSLSQNTMVEKFIDQKPKENKLNDVNDDRNAPKRNVETLKISNDVNME